METIHLAEHTVTLKGSLEAAWQKMVDWKSMPEWDLLMKSVHFDGPLAPGSRGLLKLNNGQSFALKVTSLSEFREYTDEFSVLGSRMIFHHELMPSGNNQVNMRFVVESDGLLFGLLRSYLSEDLSKKLPDLMNRFKSQFEESTRH